MVTSLAFIVYFVGDGNLTESNFSIQAVNIAFQNTEVIGLVAWVLLFWFYLRYKQISESKLSTGLFVDVKSLCRNKLLTRYLSRKTGKPFEAEGGFIVHQIVPRKGSWHAKISMVSGGKIDEHGRYSNYKAIASTTHSIQWAWAGVVRFSIWLSAALKGPSIGSWAVPQAMFWLACLLGLANFVQKLIG